MRHQIFRKKLNLKASHKKALLRNQIIHLINYGFLKTTKPRIKQVQRLAEKMVTLAREGYTFNNIRKIKQHLPYDAKAVEKLFKEIAPKYVERTGGYTRVISLGARESDTAPIAKLEWV